MIREEWQCARSEPFITEDDERGGLNSTTVRETAEEIARRV
jgi:hypothetical protein